MCNPRIYLLSSRNRDTGPNLATNTGPADPSFGLPLTQKIGPAQKWSPGPILAAKNGPSGPLLVGKNGPPCQKQDQIWQPELVRGITFGRHHTQHAH